MISLSRYFTLICKDIVIQKNMTLLALFYVFIPCFIDSKMYLSNTFVIMNMMITAEISFINIAYFYLEDRDNGNKFLVTTSYTRKDMVISKYSFLLILSFLQLLISYSIAYLNLGFEELKINTLSVFLFNVLFANIAIALITPLCFLKINALTKTIFTCIIWTAIECIPMILDFNSHICHSNLNYIFYLSISLSIIIIYISILISNKIFKNQDF